MTLYDLNNPSDPVNFYAATHEAAFCATILVGRGMYEAKPLTKNGNEDEDAKAVPMFLMGIGFEDFLKGLGFEDLEAVIEAHRADTVAALRTFATSTPKERVLYDMALSKMGEKERAEFVAEWEDLRRGSSNRIVASAHSLADAVEKGPDPDDDGEPDA